MIALTVEVKRVIATARIDAELHDTALVLWPTVRPNGSGNARSGATTSMSTPAVGGLGYFLSSPIHNPFLVSLIRNPSRKNAP